MNQMFEIMNEMGRNAFEAARQLGEINLRTMDRLAEQQLELFSQNLERGVTTTKRFADAKGYKDVLSVQADVAQDLAETATEQTRKTMAVLTEARNSVNDLLQRELKEAAEKTAKAAQPRTKAA